MVHDSPLHRLLQEITRRARDHARAKFLALLRIINDELRCLQSIANDLVDPTASLRFFKNPAGAKAEIRRLFGDALVAWGDASPVRFTERDDAWDFEVVVRQEDNCSPTGGVLASAFFPDAGRHEIVLYPKMFSQSRREQVETLVHEIGHVFGLRHFFANITETRWRSEIFGTHEPFTIMNYGAKVCSPMRQERPKALVSARVAW